ncbi:MAG: motility protein A [Proteobacteria bacterium]|nr:motility protein A [Pseudomonadota bacterium]
MNEIISEQIYGGEYSSPTLDKTTIIGITSAIGLVTLAILLGGNFLIFLDVKSFLIVVGGTIGATLVSFPMKDLERSMRILRTAFIADERSSYLRVAEIVNYAQRAKEQGMLSLENQIFSADDPFVKKSLQLLADGISAEEIQRTLEIEILRSQDRHKRGAQIFQNMGTVAPAMGLVGTLIGLVEMLHNLSDPSKIGPGMATAFLTTFYGSLLAYVIFLPLAAKLRTRSQEELTLKEMTAEGMISIANNVNPRIIEQRLLCFLAPEQRLSKYDYKF